MFEKEAEEILSKHCDCELLSECVERIRIRCSDFEEKKKLLLKGIEFGFAKANEWHYVKDEKMPKFDEGTEIKFLKGKYTKAERIVICLCEDNDYQNIYAWKEIVLPELKGE
jgi:hypothetical protein